MVLGRGYERNAFRIWRKLEGINGSFIEVKIDDRIVDVAMHAIGNNFEGNLYVVHNVKDINVILVETQCIDLKKGI